MPVISPRRFEMRRKRSIAWLSPCTTRGQIDACAASSRANSVTRSTSASSAVFCRMAVSAIVTCFQAACDVIPSSRPICSYVAPAIRRATALRLRSAAFARLGAVGLCWMSIYQSLSVNPANVNTRESGGHAF